MKGRCARSLDLFIVKRDDLKTVIAGYPWFLDWGATPSSSCAA